MKIDNKTNSILRINTVILLACITLTTCTKPLHEVITNKGTTTDDVEALTKTESIDSIQATDTTLENSDKECTFDISTQSEAVIESIKKFKNYTWLDGSKNTAIIELDNNNSLAVTRGGCNHYTMNSTLTLPVNQLDITDESTIIQKALWIVENSFDDIYYQELTEKIKNKEYDVESTADSYFLSIHDEFLTDYAISVTKHENTVNISVGFYIY